MAPICGSISFEDLPPELQIMILEQTPLWRRFDPHYATRGYHFGMRIANGRLVTAALDCRCDCDKSRPSSNHSVASNRTTLRCEG